MECFLEFEVIGNFVSLLIYGDKCLIWWLWCYDRCFFNVWKNDVESGFDFIDVIERVFVDVKEIKVKREYRDVVVFS